MNDILVKFINDNEDLIDNNNWGELFKKVRIENYNSKNINVRELLHIMMAAEIDIDFNNFLTINENSNRNIKVYTNDNNLAISSKNNFELSDLITLMKERHCYINYNRDSNSKEVKFFVFVSKESKSITDDEELKKYFDTYAKKLYEKATGENATVLDLFFLLAYHAIDKIEFKPKEEMTKLVSESRNINGYYHYPIHSKDVDTSTIDESHSSTYGYTQQELLGCYIDRSWKNVNLGADNHNIYLCKEYIKEIGNEIGENFNHGKDCAEGILILTLLHEFGHLVFSYLDYETIYEGDGKRIHESRANFFASYIFDGKVDECIKQKVSLQPKEYKEPLLYSEDKWKNDKAIKEIYP